MPAPSPARPLTGDALLAAWRDLKEAEPALRARDAAERLGASEGALLDARRGDAAEGDIRRLGPEGAGFAPLIEGLKAVGRVMTLTRNDACVHETYGTVREVESFGQMGQVVGPIDLRLFYARWRAGFAVVETLQSGLRQSLHFYDLAGDSILKVYATEETDTDAWRALTARHEHADAPPAAFSPRPAPPVDRPDAAIDRDALRSGWETLEHTHAFHALLKKTGASRLQALRLIGGAFAEQLTPSSVQPLLETIAGTRTPAMLFAGNEGCIQIFSGALSRIRPMGPWLNVLDPDFHMHLRLDRVASVWRVRKPTTSSGMITSIELFDAGGALLLQIFGVRASGDGENPAWRRIAEAAPALTDPAPALSGDQP